jgi:methyl-accepting chemotaxis protein
MLAVLILVPMTTIFAAENCTEANKKAVCKKEVVKAKVDEMCKIVETKGKAGIAEVKKFRYDCCGEPDYIWINDMQPKMIMHPIKPQLDGTDLSKNADPDGKKLFVAFVEEVKKNPKGGWVPYKWTKLGESDPSNKVSWVKQCTTSDTNEAWVVGSGTWE